MLIFVLTRSSYIDLASSKSFISLLSKDQFLKIVDGVGEPLQLIGERHFRRRQVSDVLPDGRLELPELLRKSLQVGEERHVDGPLGGDPERVAACRQK